jgi:hypothetical protein
MAWQIEVDVGGTFTDLLRRQGAFDPGGPVGRLHPYPLRAAHWAHRKQGAFRHLPIPMLKVDDDDQRRDPGRPMSGKLGWLPVRSLTLRWRKTDSNSRSLREGKGCGQPLQASIAVSDLNL